MEEKNLICICCPLGCPLTVALENGEVVSVTGNTVPAALLTVAGRSPIQPVS